MAEENAESQPENAGGGKKKLILLVVIGLLLVGLSVGGTLVALKFLGGDETAQSTAD
ncbi:MAG: flagellar basal body-associated protein FliL, partial [Pseudomonadota bacterium]|nr:flagellar basal body-associated protein FliL [Pseudomonadota bacterium]